MSRELTLVQALRHDVDVRNPQAHGQELPFRLRYTTSNFLGLSGKKTPGGAGIHMGHTGAHGHTDHTDEPHNRPKTNAPARQRDDRIRGRLNSRSPGADRSPRPNQKRPPPANPTLPPPAPRAPPRACSKAGLRPVGANADGSGPRARGVRWSGGRPRAPAVRDRETYLACCSHRLVAYTAYLTAYKQVLFSFTLNELSLKAHSHRHTRPAPSTSHHFACLVRTDRATVGVGRGQCIPRTHARTHRSA